MGNSKLSELLSHPDSSDHQSTFRQSIFEPTLAQPQKQDALLPPESRVYLFGASGDLGSDLLAHLLAQNVEVIAFSNQHPERLLAYSEHPKFKHQSLDLLHTEQARLFLRQLISECGAPTHLVFAAGLSHYALFQDTEAQKDLDLFKIALLTPAELIKETLPHFFAKGRGNILFYASIWGLHSAAMEAMYAASKAAQIALTQSLAKELGPSGIRVNALAPGWIEGQMNARFSEEERQAFEQELALFRIGKAEEVSQAALFLMSESASYITGEVLRVDGGF